MPEHTGLAVWFKTRSGLWRRSHQRLLGGTLLLAICAGLAGLSISLPNFPNLSAYFPGIRAYGYLQYFTTCSTYALTVLLATSVAFHCEQLRPPAELTGSYTDGQLLYLTRNRFLRISLVAFAAYLLPVLLLANLPYLKGIANQSDPSALLMDLLPLLDMLVIGLLPAFISCAVNLHLPRFSISLRIMLVLLLLVGSVALGMLPYRYFLDRILNQSDPDQINRLMLQMTLAYTLLHCAALLLAALLALILPKRLARA